MSRKNTIFTPHLSRRAALTGIAATAVFGVVASAIAADPGAAPAAPSDYPMALGRPHTDYVYMQLGPGRVLGETNSQPGAWAGTASYDAKGTRATSGIFRYDAGWNFPKAHYIDSDQELFVLDGVLSIDGVDYGAGSYCYLPAGKHHDLMESKKGATVLNFYEGQHIAHYDAAPAGMYNPAKLVEKIDTAKTKWTKGTADDIAAWGKSAQRKTLRVDKKTGESTWLLKVAADPSDVKRKLATHATVEEIFIIEGSIASPLGVMNEGAYAWRVPGTEVGPFGTKTGFVMLVRSKGGAQKTTWSKDAKPVVWDAPYKPNLDKGQQAWAFKDLDKAKRW